MKKQTLKEKAFTEIKALILKGELKAGDYITERELVEQLSMSRTPIRSAIDRLEVEGLIKNIPNKGPIIEEISVKKAKDIFDVRIALESHVAMKLSAKPLTQAQKNWFNDNFSKQKQYLDQKDDASFSAVDAEFHYELMNIYQNNEVIRIFEQIQDQLQLLALKVFQTNIEDLTVYYNHHQNIYRSIINQDGKSAAKLMIEHLEIGKRIITR